MSEFKMLGKRIDFHIHSIFSDGVLVPSEWARRAQVLDYEAIAITDHVDFSNIESIVPSILKVSKELNKELEVKVIPGVEITHVPPSSISKLALKAKKLGAKVILVHGETLAEPVAPMTNHETVKCEEVDVLTHPGLIKEEDAELAKENEVFLELTSRSGHCLSNGHIVNLFKKIGVKILINSDAHEPEDLITQDYAYKMALGSGLNREEALKVLKDYAHELLKKVLERF
ncbi:MAG: histidinol phosphate phosphatase domain-containing protein [Candidatus Bathyarchaeia archaeon]